MTDECVIRRKLILDGDGTGDDKRLQAFLKHATKWINTDMSPTESDQALDSLLAELHVFELNGKKSDLIVKSSRAQLKKYRDMHSMFEEKIKQINADISDQEELLKKAKIFRNNQIKYALVAQTVDQQPSRRTLTERIVPLKRELAELLSKKDSLNKQWNLRKKQCYVLSTSANELKGILRGGSQKPNNVHSHELHTMVVEEEVL